jgi:hypothetical protein
MKKLLIAAGIAAALTNPARAEIDNSTKLKNTGERLAFAMACPKHWERLPPRTQRVIMAISDDVTAANGKDAVRAAALEAYASGYDKQGERWCDSMLPVLDQRF